MRIGVRTNESRVPDEVFQAIGKRGWPTQSGSESEVDLLFSIHVAQASGRRGLRNYNLLYVNSYRAARSLDFKPLLVTLLDQLDGLLMVSVKDVVFVAGGLIEFGGQCLLLPGFFPEEEAASLKALRLAGATIWGQEYLILDSQCEARPYPENVERTFSIDGVAFITDGEGGANISTMTPGESALNLFEYTVSGRQSPAEALRILSSVCSQTCSYRVPSRTKVDWVATLIEELSSS